MIFEGLSYEPPCNAEDKDNRLRGEKFEFNS